jgi:4-diphosphocytidyl-2-C-methyl-D-erythritol kinase
MDAPPFALDVRAHAKLNLFLHITGQRPDGYHLLQSVFVRIDWHDRLRVVRRADGQLHRHDISTALPAQDLCLQAAQALQQASQCTWGADIHIDKQLPSGAGMGGGSADAAAVLMALNTLWDLHWPTPRLADIAVTLGADVPFFLHEQNAWVEGIGEQIQPLTLPDHLFKTPIAIIKPPVDVPTRSVFTHPALPRQTAPATPTDFWLNPCHFGRNDMQTVACEICPEIAQALDILRNMHGNARMTGSGSAVFAWLPQDADAAAAHRQLTDTLPPGWTGRICYLQPLTHLLSPLPPRI